ncbi:MAG: DUF2975 domain-containing protein [Candidatus Kaiserbacteria bacterium]|nr:MAG: DUF2975 domain-containing protein [Candidatus Kaiserbacteria bacterium]
MKYGSIFFLRVATFLMGAVALVLVAIFTFVVIGKSGGSPFLPILILIYLTLIPFLYALYLVIKLLTNIGADRAFSKSSIGALRRIKYCAVVISALYVVGLPFMIQVADADDAPGGVLIALFLIVGSLAVATLASVLQKVVQHGFEERSKNELTV